MNDFPINEQIRSPIVFLILANGEKRGQFAKSAAIMLARNEGLDLVQVSAGNPPVCKIADHGKLKYERSKAQKNHTKQPDEKQIWFKPKTDPHDIEIKMKRFREWINGGHKVLLGVKLKGRECYCEVQRGIARDLLLRLGEDNKDFASLGKVSEGLKAIMTVCSRA